MMPNSSPEYAITKPGMAHILSRKRDKPLRTYGKRSVSTPEPPSKRMRLESDEPTQDGNTLASGQSEPAQKDGQSSVPSVEGETRKHPSILSYFKPVAPRERAVSSLNTTEDAEEPDLSPVSSTASRPKRKPRLLRLRATSSPLSDAPEDPAADGEDTTKRRRDGRDEVDDGANRTNSRGSPLRDGGDNRRNQTNGAKAPDETKPGGAARAKKAPTVQTTLNLSAQAAFAECKVCDTVWNPLYPDDVRYHSKRHATVVRARRKQEDGL